MSFPPSVPDWDNLAVLHRNTLPPRPHFFLYDDEAAARARDTAAARAQCLSGTWQFQLSTTPLEGPSDFWRAGFDTAAAGFGDIAVPGMWQCQGHGAGPQYANIVYPWPMDPPHIPREHNECGRYVRTFAVDPRLATAGAQLRLRFEGVDAAFTVWLNGREVGYSQGSRNASEFDVSPLIVSGDNVLAVEVYQRCDGSYIEDQDQWWLSGIFRDVWLHSFPAAHPEDVQIETALDDVFQNAVLRVKLQMSAACDVALRLLDAKGQVVATASQPFLAGVPGHFAVPVVRPQLWTAETPYLYSLVFTFNGTTLLQRVGFRRAELRDGVFCVNGWPVKLRGVNRHEHHPDSGRAVPFEFLQHDLLLMKQHGINAIRTSHQPNDVRLYDLADELGLWILDEADLECHGADEIGLADPAAPLSDNPAWEAAYLDRARHLVQRDKNWTSVVIWSLGNESFYGRNHQAMYDLIHAVDPTRIIHYEGDQDARTADVFSRMYPEVQTVVDMARGVCVQRNKPLVLCEFVHAMGNGPGGIREYIDAFYQHPRLMGGFLWEWCNHGLRTKTAAGETFFAYGGDFGDEPNDGNFILDGCVFSDHTPTPGLLEYAKAIEPVQTLRREHETRVTIANRYDCLSLDHLVCRWEVVADDGVTVDGGDVAIPPGIRPHTTATLLLDGLHAALAKTAGRESYLKLRFCQRAATAWAPAGHQVAFGELPLAGPPPFASLVSTLSSALPSTSSPTLQQTASTLKVTSASGASVWTFDLARGTLASWARHGVEILSQPPAMDFYRPLTDNDRPLHGQNWRDRRLHETRPYVRGVTWETTPENGVDVVVRSRIAPPVLAWGVDTVWTFSLRGDAVLLRIQGHPHGPWLPDFFARVGLTLGLAPPVGGVRWFGRGPGESYADKKHSQAMGTWAAESVDDLFVDYEFPQDCGNRTDVRWVEVAAAAAAPSDTPTTSTTSTTDTASDKCPLLRARFDRLASFAALHYDAADLDQCTHPYQLHHRKRTDTLLRLDWMHHGLGTGSCGPATTPAYQLKPADFDVSVLLD